MRIFLLTLAVLICFPGLALADGGGPYIPDEAIINHTTAITLDLELIEMDQPTELDNWDIDFGSDEFLSQAGSIAWSTIYLIDQNITLGKVTLLLVAILCMVWLLGFVLQKRMDAQIRDLEHFYYNADPSPEELALAQQKIADLKQQRQNSPARQFRNFVFREAGNAAFRQVGKWTIRRISRGRGGRNDFL